MGSRYLVGYYETDGGVPDVHVLAPRVSGLGVEPGTVTFRGIHDAPYPPCSPDNLARMTSATWSAPPRFRMAEGGAPRFRRTSLR